MIEAPESSRDDNDLPKPGVGLTMPDAKAWFVREVLPLEAALKQFIRRRWRDKSEVDDLRQEVYARVFEAAQRQIPYPMKPFVFTAAYNLLVDQMRREQVVSIEAVPNLDTLNVALDEPWPDRSVRGLPRACAIRSTCRRIRISIICSIAWGATASF